MANEAFIKRVVESAANGGRDKVPADVDNRILLLAMSELADSVHDMPCQKVNDPNNPIIRLNRVEWLSKILIGLVTLVIAPVGVWAIISIVGKISELLAAHN